jgi:hypothetical protein
MATQVQLRRGNTTQTNAFTGALAEITIDTDKKTVVVHDGSTAGGFPLALESAQQDIFAFATANAAFDQANAAFDSANINSTLLSSSYNHTNAAFDKANSANILAQAAFDYANTIISDTQIDPYARNHANAAFNQANTNLNSVTAAFNLANGTAGVANTDVTNISILADTYGNSTHVPVINTSANGRIESIATVAITASDPNALAFAIALG